MSSPLEVQNKATILTTSCPASHPHGASAFLYYDYAITWPREVQHIWMHKFSLLTILYFACRYAMVPNVIYILALAEQLLMMRTFMLWGLCANDNILTPNYRIAIVVIMDISLRPYLHALGGLLLFCMNWTVVWGLRTYAVSNRNTAILVIFGILGTCYIGLAILHVPYVACDGHRGTPPSVTVLTICNVVLQYAAPDLGTSLRHMSFIKRLLNAHTLPLSGLMTARFLLHLRVWNHRQSTNTFPETPSAVLFKNMGIDVQTGCSARASYIMCSIADEFGEDPVAQARQRAVSADDVEDAGRAERHSEV
ncbi:hypothetical protein NLJ89_g5203 [Agrocybe chaxingu]|uniref:DUF6533 domain-containing protein n=1 Tax=Agrocybe chaxingu TaxID=84603 RepID=A0A9W8MVU4_9AGAR|nr:hypothetical protein NLJ89_g5203 [Agrocybe chaxingu]